MAYTIAQLITQAQTGGAVKVTLTAPNTDVVLNFGDKKLLLSQKHETVTLATGNVITPSATDPLNRSITSTNRSVVDLGTLYTAEEVIGSFTLKQAITDGLVIAEAGTVALALTPVKANA